MEYTAKAVARAVGITPATRRFVLRDEYGLPYDGRQYDLVLAALSRPDRTPTLDARLHTVAYALRKSMTSGRMPAASENRIAEYSPYQLCALVARVANDCLETTVGGICDGWIAAHHVEL